MEDLDYLLDDQKTLQIGGEIVTFIRRLGKGGGGASVWHVERKSAMRKTEVALKCFLFHRADQLTNDVKRVVNQLEHNELEIWVKFSELSENVVKILGDVKEPIGIEDVMIIGFYMELSALGDLAQFKLSSPVVFNETRHVRDIMLDIATAIAPGHDDGMFHCDIKPQNVVVHKIQGKYVAKVMDFGTSYDTHSSQHVMGGTPKYMAPELLADVNCKPSAKTDVYSLGLLYYELWTGSVIHDGFTEKVVVNEKDEGLRRIALRAGHGMSVLIRHMLQRDPTARPDLSYVVRELRDQSHESIHGEMQRAKDQAILTPNAFRWFPDVHAMLGHTLVYGLIVPHGPSELERVQHELEQIGLHGFSLVRVLGGVDYLLRCWTDAHGLDVLDRYVRSLHEGKSGKGQIFRVENYNLWYSRKSVPALSVNMVDDVLYAASKAPDVESQYSILKDAKLVHSFLSTGSQSKPTSASTKTRRNFRIRFFILLRCSEDISSKEASGIIKTLEDGLKNSKVVDLSVHTGVGPTHWFGFIKFRLNDFFAIADVHGGIVAALSDYRSGLVFYTQTFAEVDRSSQIESDDGPLLRSARERLKTRY